MLPQCLATIVKANIRHLTTDHEEAVPTSLIPRFPRKVGGGCLGTTLGTNSASKQAHTEANS